MRKEEFLKKLGKALGDISEKERSEILYDYEEHFSIGMENGKTEEQICSELGDPVEIANNYLSDRINEKTEYKSKEEKINDKNLSGFVSNKRFAIITGILVCFFVGCLAISRYNNSNNYSKRNMVRTGGIRIDSSGIHGNGISIDKNGIKVPRSNVNEDEVNVPDVSIDNDGINVPGITVDSNGIKAPGVKIDDEGININIKK